MNHRYLSTPWAHRCDLYSPPGSLIVKIALGEAPDTIPTALDVRSGVQQAVSRLSIGAVDRVLQHFAERIRITRVHSAAATFSHPGSKRQSFDDLEHAIGLSRTFRVNAEHTCCITDLIDALRQLAVVEEAYPHYLSTLPFAAAQLPSGGFHHAWWSREQVEAAEALGYEPGDPATIVAVVDTGVIQTHPELRTHLRAGLDTVQLVIDDLALGITLMGDHSTLDTDPEDLVGHGTSCAAIIGAAGEHLPPGLAGDCSLLPVRVLGAAQFPGKIALVGIGAIADIDLGVKCAIDLGAKVINMSFGTAEAALERHDPLPHQDVVRYGLARGCIMIAASGNSGKAERYAPAALDGVIAVGAVDAAGQPASFSTRGAHVALAAPGERIVSAGLDGYAMVTGTSFAAPFVAAATALLVSRAERRSSPLDGPTVRRILCDSAQPWPQGVGEGHGAGVLNVHAALRALDHEIDTRRNEGALF
jgi:subtilisin family serine protease